MKGAARRPSTRGSWAAVCGVALLVPLSHSALLARSAERAQTLSVGPSTALASCEAVSSRSDNRTKARFPRHAEVRFHTRLAGGIGQTPASDEAGNLIVAHGEPRLSKLDAQGRSLWSTRLPSEAACAPVLLANGSILIATRDAEALVFRASGQLQYRQPLPFGDPRRRTLAIPTTNGGALLASGADLLELDAQAQLVRQTRARGNVTGLAESGSLLVAVGENGTVETARATGDFELVGSLGGSAAEGGAVLGGSLLAVIDGHKLVTLDLDTGQVLTLATEPALALTGPLALFGNRGVALIADGGFVSLRTRDGAETTRASVALAAQAFDPAARGLRAASLIGDDVGDVAAVRAASNALLLYADGTSTRFDDTACLDPFRPTPTRGGIAFTCRSGQIFLVSDKAQ